MQEVTVQETPVQETRPRHFVDSAPFDPAAALAHGHDAATDTASAWRLIGRKFLRHRLAVASAIILALLYATIPMVEPSPTKSGMTMHWQASR